MGDNAIDRDALGILRHDIKNQLSNINLIIGELRHELTDASPDCILYLDMLAKSASTINDLLKEKDQ